MYKEITKCRICESKKIITVISLGDQYLTGVFPKQKDEKLTIGPVDLVWCSDCNLLQMKQSYSLDEMYGDNYGYRSGLNQSMVKHLQKKIQNLEKLANPNEKDLVIDIGSNDATSLKAYTGKFRKVGIDPTGKKFKEYYNEDIKLIPDFFTAKKFNEIFPNEKAKIITSIAMFYDLENPTSFVKDIESCLDNDGIWHFEQSYMPSMLKTNSYDTICHEHIEFYSLKVVKNLLEACELRIIDVQMNDINGGSFAVTACKTNSNYKSNTVLINWLLEEEKKMELDTIKPYQEFSKRILLHKGKIKDLINRLISDGKKVFIYGASTKGNVLLQYCEFSDNEFEFVAEVNPEKFGSFTPGTNIPIISEKQAKGMYPDYFFVLPWHFKNDILSREEEYIANGGKFIFPLPEIEII
jgi:hypothetical protein